MTHKFPAGVLSLLMMSSSAFAYDIPTLAERRAMVQEVQQSQTQKPEPRVATPSTSASASTTAKITTEASAYPQYAAGTIVIRTNERRLHFIESDGSMTTYPIAVGREGAQWVGTTHVTGKRKNPDWRPTPNMRKKDPKLPEVMKAGPTNPLGIRAIYLSEGYLRIHGTNQPRSIGKAASSGCYRMHNEHVSDLYERVAQGAKVVVLR